MSSFAFVAQILTDHTMSGLRQEAVDEERYGIFFDAHVAYSCRLLKSYYNGNGPDNIFALISVSAEMCPRHVTGGFGGGEDALPYTWADFATRLRNALVTNMNAHNDDFTVFRIAMFVRNMRLELNARVGVVRRRRRALAIAFVNFILNEAAEAQPPAEEADDAEPPAEEADDAEPPAEEADDAEPPAEEADDAEPPAEEADDAEPPAEEADDAEPPAEEADDAEPPAEEADDAEPPAEEADDAEPPAEVFAVDEDGDVVMETQDMASDGNGSKRRTRALTYEEEVSRERDARRSDNLRNTGSQEERLARLRGTEDPKRKVDIGAGSSPRSSRKRSRR